MGLLEKIVGAVCLRRRNGAAHGRLWGGGGGGKGRVRILGP